MKRNRELAKKYAAALFTIVLDNGALEEVETQLVGIRDAVRENPELSGFLNHPILAREAKKEVVEKLFADTIQPVLIKFLSVVIDRGRIELLEEMTDEFVRLSHEARHLAEATVRTAVPLTEDEEKSLKERLQALTGKDVSITATVDPSILGGMIVKIGDRMIDGSMIRQLQELKATILKQDTKGLR